jgi:hypothetical protein
VSAERLKRYAQGNGRRANEVYFDPELGGLWNGRLIVQSSRVGASSCQSASPSVISSCPPSG